MDVNEGKDANRDTVPTDATQSTGQAGAPAQPHRQTILPPAIEKMASGIFEHNDEEHTSRYKIGDLLGCGAFGQIYSAFDRNIGRKIAIKSPLPGAMHDKDKLNFFLHEARLTASLQHPNIMPIYDLDTDSRGRPYFTMRQIEGISLGEAIDRAAAGDVMPEIASYTSRVNIMLKVLDAVVYVHSCGIIHQDIKPDNVMLGKFGEVVLSDWGTASFATEYPEGRLIGTPLFMPPEQSQHRPVSPANDIYAIGATLYNLLTWQYPMDDQDSDQFWDKKFAGVYDDLPPAIERDVPKVLLDIARKAMSVNISDRYPTAAAMAQDLRNYLEDAAVSAHHETPWEAARRLCRHRMRAVLLALLALILLCGMAYMWRQEKKRGESDWQPLAGATAALDTEHDLSENWTERGGTYTMPIDDIIPGSPQSAWHIRKGVIYGRVSDNIMFGRDHSISNLCWKHNIFGGIRVEFSLTPFDAPLNLNCFIGGRTRDNSYVFHIGGWDDQLSCVLTKGKSMDWMVEKRLTEPLSLFQEHEFCMEYDNGHVRLFINKQLIIEYHDWDPLSGIDHQTFGFETDINARAIRDIRIYQKPIAEKISPLSVPNAMMQVSRYHDAIAYYQSLIHHYPGTEYDFLSRLRTAICLKKLDRDDEAVKIYREIIDQAPRTAPVRLNAMLALGEYYIGNDMLNEWDEIVSKIAISFPGHEDCSHMLDFYSKYWQKRLLLGTKNVNDVAPRIEKCIAKIKELSDKLGFKTSKPFFDYSSFAFRLFYNGEWDTYLRLFAWRDDMRVNILNEMGEYRKVVRENLPNNLKIADALIYTGQFAEAIKRFPYYITAYIAAGDYASAWRYARTHKNRFRLLVLEGKFTEAANIATGFNEKLLVKIIANPDSPLSSFFNTQKKQTDDAADEDEENKFDEDEYIAELTMRFLESQGPGRMLILENTEKALLALAQPNADAARQAADACVRLLKNGNAEEFNNKVWTPEYGALLTCLAQHAAGDKDAAVVNLQDLEKFCQSKPYRFNRLLPYIEYITGKITDDALTSRCNLILPHEKKAALLLANAWKADLAGDTEAAVRNYAEWKALPQQLQFASFAYLPYLRQFTRLRLQALRPGEKK